MKDHLSDHYALIILLSAALGSGFLSLPYSLRKFPTGSKKSLTESNILASLLLMFNYFSGMISCYFLAHTVKMTKLESF